MIYLVKMFSLWNTEWYGACIYKANSKKCYPNYAENHFPQNASKNRNPVHERTLLSNILWHKGILLKTFTSFCFRICRRRLLSGFWSRYLWPKYTWSEWRSKMVLGIHSLCPDVIENLSVTDPAACRTNILGISARNWLSGNLACKSSYDTLKEQNVLAALINDKLVAGISCLKIWKW